MNMFLEFKSWTCSVYIKFPRSQPWRQMRMPNELRTASGFLRRVLRETSHKELNLGDFVPISPFLKLRSVSVLGPSIILSDKCLPILSCLPVIKCRR